MERTDCCEDNNQPQINCYDAKSGELICTYNSVNEVLRTVNGKNSNIVSAIKNNSVYKGRIYSYS